MDQNMFFTSVARLMAWIITLLGAFGIAIGIFGMTFEDKNRFAADYMGADGFGVEFDQRIFMFLFGIVLGVLTDISRSIRNIE